MYAAIKEPERRALAAAMAEYEARKAVTVCPPAYVAPTEHARHRFDHGGGYQELPGKERIRRAMSASIKEHKSEEAKAKIRAKFADSNAEYARRMAERRRKLASEYRSGVSDDAIAERLGIRRDSLRRLLRMEGIEFETDLSKRRKPKLVKPADLAVMVKMYVVEVKSCDAIGRELGFDPKTVHNNLKAAGTKMRARGVMKRKN